jgi:hypothetical protein
MASKGGDQMPAAEELPTGQQPHRRQSRRVRKIDFEQLDGLSTSADQEQKYDFGRMDGVA